MEGRKRWRGAAGSLYELPTLRAAVLGSLHGHKALPSKYRMSSQFGDSWGLTARESQGEFCGGKIKSRLLQQDQEITGLPSDPGGFL